MLGTLYTGNGVETCAFLGAIGHQLRMIGSDVVKHFPNDTVSAFEKFMSLKKVAFFDIAIRRSCRSATRCSSCPSSG